MKIKVSQLAYGDFARPDHWFVVAEKINRLYCERYGYEYAAERLSEHGQINRHGNWAKVAHIKRCLADCDYLFYLDADACFYCHALAIHKEILPMLPPDKVMLFSADINGETFRWNPERTSSGVILLRNSEIAHQILDEWETVSQMPEYEHTCWGWPTEQAALTEFICPKWKDSIQVHQEYYQLQSRYGYFVRHLAVSSNEERRAEFQAIYETLSHTRQYDPQ